MKQPEEVRLLEDACAVSGSWLDEVRVQDAWIVLYYIAYLERWREQAIETHSALENMVVTPRRNENAVR